METLGIKFEKVMGKFIDYILLFAQVIAVVCNIVVLIFPQLRSQTVIYLIVVLGYGCGVALSIRILSKNKG